MIKLSERLECIANRIDKGETVADIGTDHAYLPIYLWENEVSPKVIMADISKGSLQKAKENCNLTHPDVDFDCRLGDGLEVLQPHEVDTVVMAGMGALLIIEMLEWDIIKTRSYKKFILQPRNNLGELVKWLKFNNFDIIHYDLVKEGKRICEILTASTQDTKSDSDDCFSRKVKKMDDESSDSTAEYDFPDLLLEHRNKYSLEYIDLHLQKENFILQNIKMSSDCENNHNLKRRLERKRRLEELKSRLLEVTYEA